MFRHGAAAGVRTVFPGNREFIPAIVSRGPRWRAGGGSARRTRRRQRCLRFQVTRDEYLELMFEDLELPNSSSVNSRATLPARARRAIARWRTRPISASSARSRFPFARRIALSARSRHRVPALEDELVLREGTGDEVTARRSERVVGTAP